MILNRKGVVLLHFVQETNRKLSYVPVDIHQLFSSSVALDVLQGIVIVPIEILNTQTRHLQRRNYTS